jgi:hypothetical protein
VSWIKKRAQSGIEYLAIVGIALLVLTSGMLIFSNYARTSSDDVTSNQLNLIGNTIMTNAEAMYVLGNESWITIEFNFPKVVSNAAINNNQEMFFAYSTSRGDSYAVFFSDKFNLSNGTSTCSTTCNLNFMPGINKVKIHSIGNKVNIMRIS